MTIFTTISNVVLRKPATQQKFPFDSRETYLAWRAQWKADYKALSAEIVAIKRKLRRPNGSTLSTDEQAALQSQHHYLAQKATYALMTLAEAKEQAKQQYEASRATKQVPDVA